MRSCSGRYIWYISTSTGSFSQVQGIELNGNEAGCTSTITIASRVRILAYGAISVSNSMLHPPGTGAVERTINWWMGLIVLFNGKFIIESASCPRVYVKQKKINDIQCWSGYHFSDRNWKYIDKIETFGVLMEIFFFFFCMKKIEIETFEEWFW